MRQYINLLGLGLAVLVLLGCQGVNLEVSDKNNFNPGDYETYAWVKDSPSQRTSKNPGFSVLDKVLRRELEESMAAKGYRRTDRADADFLVNYSFAVDSLLDEEKPHKKVIAEKGGWAASVRFDDGQSNAPQPAVIEQANLLLAFQAKDGKVIWQAIAKKAISNQYADQEQYKKVIKRTLTRMFLDVPAR